MFDVQDNFLNYITRYEMISKGDHVLAAVSGGADSVCMLVLLDRLSKTFKDLELSIGAVCVDHGFRPEAAYEAEYVRKLCQERDIPFFLKKIEPGEIRSSEEEARIYRYRLINEVAAKEGYNKIALAHNVQDRAETVLFNLFRGTGLAGLIGVRPVRDQYIRPILWMERSDIEGYLTEQGIEWCTDGSNLSDQYSRNKIRHHLIPEALEINEGAIRHISETSQRLSELEEYIRSEAEVRLRSVLVTEQNEKKLSTQTLLTIKPVVRNEMYRLVLIDMSPHLKDITSEHISMIDSLVDRDSNGEVHLPYGIRVIRSYDNLVFMKRTTEDTRLSYTISERVFDASSIDGRPQDEAPRNKYTKWFDYDKINGSVKPRYRMEGDEIVVDSLGHRKSVGRYMIEEKIPKHIRDQIPVIATDRDILWIVGYRDSCAYRIDETTKKILEIKITTED